MHMVLRVHMCGVVCINVRAYLCVACACVCGCVYMWISVYIHVCKCLPNGGYKSTNILTKHVLTCISIHTSTKQHSYAISNFFPCYMLTTDTM